MNPINVTEPSKIKRPLIIGTSFEGLTALLFIILVQFLVFGPIIGKIGFYLDDWAMFSNLHFGPQSWWALNQHCFADPRVAIRPPEAPYFVTLYTLFGVNPIAHHLVNALFEILGSWFLFLSLRRLGTASAVSLVGALLFLLYPAHDATHYWFTASSATMSLSLCVISLWLGLVALQDKKWWFWLWSVLVFAISAFNYEADMPLCILTWCTAFYLELKARPLPKALIRSAIFFLPYVLTVATTYTYQRVWLAAQPGSYTRAMLFDPNNILKVIVEGVNCTLSPTAFSFFTEQARQWLSTGVSSGRISYLILLSVMSVIVLCWWSKEREQSWQSGLLLIACGLVTLIAAFTIFGIAANYHPDLYSIMNRINAGGTLGACLILTGFLSLLSYMIWSRSMRALVLCLLTVPVLVFFTLADWGYSKPWIASWMLQKHIQAAVAKRASQFHNGDSIILANAPRYVMWSPMFDGVWDFQSMLHLTLNNQQINGTVVSDRISVYPTEIKDISLGVTCGAYPFKHMCIYFPGQDRWLEIHSAPEFIDTIAADGMGFGLEPKTIARWRSEISSGAISSNNVRKALH